MFQIEEKNNAEGDHKKLKVEAKPTRGRAAKMVNIVSCFADALMFF